MTENELEQQGESSEGGYPHGWSEPRPRHVPPPTYAPVAFSLGLTLVAWGFLASYIVSLLGGAVMLASLWSWIADMTSAKGEE